MKFRCFQKFIIHYSAHSVADSNYSTWEVYDAFLYDIGSYLFQEVSAPKFGRTLVYTSIGKFARVLHLDYKPN